MMSRLEDGRRFSKKKAELQSEGILCSSAASDRRCDITVRSLFEARGIKLDSKCFTAVQTLLITQMDRLHPSSADTLGAGLWCFLSWLEAGHDRLAMLARNR